MLMDMGELPPPLAILSSLSCTCLYVENNQRTIVRVRGAVRTWTVSLRTRKNRLAVSFDCCLQFEN